MHSSEPWKKFTSAALILALLCLCLPTSPVTAGWIPTRPTVDGSKDRLVSLLEGQEVVAALQQLGVDPLEARRRATGLTHEEARAIMREMDSLPAGGNALVSVLTIAAVVFVVLLITDILGFTDVFPFVKKTVR